MVTLNKPVANDTDWTTEVNDNWTALETVANGSITVVKTADESVTNSTTLQDDDHLKFTIGANETWIFEIVGFWGAATAGPDIKIAINGPGTPTNFIAHLELYAANATQPGDGTVVTAYDAVEQFDFSSVPNSTLFKAKGSIINGATGGTVVLRWAQRSSNATATTVKKGSYLIASKV